MTKKRSYKICVGQVYKLWFNSDRKDLYSIIILAQVDEGKVAAIELAEFKGKERRCKDEGCLFNRWNDPVAVDDINNITTLEFDAMINYRQTELVRKKNITLVSRI